MQNQLHTQMMLEQEHAIEQQRILEAQRQFEQNRIAQTAGSTPQTASTHGQTMAFSNP
ncbi:MAG: hypothetical protein KDJ32_10845 [Alphaproteobacteria bacterium]|nr:hypothetical protein [Alphaproteobacteria bacterium]